VVSISPFQNRKRLAKHVVNFLNKSTETKNTVAKSANQKEQQKLRLARFAELSFKAIQKRAVRDVTLRLWKNKKQNKKPNVNLDAPNCQKSLVCGVVNYSDHLLTPLHSTVPIAVTNIAK